MSFIEGFELRERLFESKNSLVLRAIRNDDGLPVVIKILKNDYPTAAELARYRREYEITRSLDLPGIIRSIDLNRHEKTLLIVFEDFGGMSVASLLRERKLSTAEFLDIAVQVAESLERVHLAQIIHKDINPANLVVNPGTGEVKIIDFGISTRFVTERPVLKNPRVLEGTLAYMSPEQTGRMNRRLDYRTDLYSLGATFYEMLTGSRPFDADDDLELVHCHIARDPIPAHRRNPDVSLALSKIISKLMAKKAEARYQSAAGLVADLETVRAGASLERFEPGRNDTSDRFQIPERLYGREREVEQLLDAFERTRRGRAELMLVAGYSGVGKSALIHEVHKPITRARGYFIRGKFDQFQRNVPYSGLMAAFRDLVRQLLTENETRLAEWRRDLNAALTPNARVILDVLPELELIIGPQPSVPELGAAEASNRFNRAIGQLLRALCAHDNVVVLFLDDLQWADSATLSLLKVVLTDDGIHRLFLIGAYRDNEVDNMHPLALTLRSVRDSGAEVNTISLAPLGLADVGRLLADTLHSDAAQITPFARLVVQKTEGNPLFIRQFLIALNEEGLVKRMVASPGERSRWSWDLPAIKAAKITDNVVDLLIRKLRRLNPETQEALQLAACIGNRFDLETLALIQKTTPEQTFATLQPALKDELIVPLSDLATRDSADVLSPLIVEEFGFQHDRVQQAAYSLIEEGRRRDVHLAIGRRLLASLPREVVKERVFEVVDHLLLGRNLLKDKAEKTALAELALTATRKASDATAYTAALGYVRVAHELLGESGWTTDYELTIEANRQRAELEYLNGNFDRCTEIVTATLEHARTDLEKAEVYFTRIAQHTLLTQFPEALEAGRRALALLGIDFPLDDTIEQAGQQAIGRAMGMLGGRVPTSLFDSPDIDRADMRLAQRCLRHLTIAAFLSKQDLFPLIVGTSVGISLEFGNSADSALSFANLGLIMGAFMGRYNDGYAFGELALRLCDKYRGSAPTATVCLVVGSELIPWVKHVRHAIPVIDRGYQEGLDSGDILWAGYLVMYRVLLGTFSGKRIEELLDAMPDQLGFTSRTQNPGAAAGIIAHQIVLSTLAGRTKSSAEFAAPGIDEATFLQTCEERHIAMAICFYKILKAQALYLFGRPKLALAATQEVDGLLGYVVNHPNLADHLLYQTLSMAALWSGDGTDDGRAAMEKMKANLARLVQWSDGCPDNYMAKRLMVEAEIARITGDEANAAALYDRAIDQAHAGQFVQDEALANELAARLVIERRPTSRVGAMYLRDARYAYSLWGASRKVEELEMEFPQLLTDYRESRSSGGVAVTSGTFAGPTATGHGRVADLDLNTLLKAGQTISGEVTLARLLDRLLNIVIENAGAQRGVFLLSREGDLFVEAEGDVSSEEIAVLMSLPADSADGAARVPLGVINFAARTKEVVVVDDAGIDERFMSDPYVQKRETRSVLCQPILNQGQLIGLVYLENDLTSGAFTPERTRLLELLSGQIAVSIKNAEVVEHLEEKVRERTEQLEVRTRFIEQTFGRYMSNEIADSLLKSPDALDFSGKKKVATIMMSDLRGFAAFSDALPPETIVSLLNNYLSEMTTVIQKYNGTIDEFIGDAILAIFGAPFQRPDDAERAVACALEMQLAMPRVNAWNAEHGLPSIEMGIGINTGEVVAGNIGSRKRAKYGVVGGNVNLAGRIEGYTIGGQILIADATRRAIKAPVTVLGERTVEPKGVAMPVTLYEVGGLGKPHALELPRRTVSWTAVEPALSLTFRMVDGKDVSTAEHHGTLVRISANAAEIHSDEAPAAFKDLKLLLKPASGEAVSGIYGKVSGAAASGGSFSLHFTAVPKEARDYIDTLLGPQ